uniref:Ovule protein n=1 Tax=Caenorhabditis tropicalis TaxID=1561998 RepID=A0A1I7U6C7_9PELO
MSNVSRAPTIVQMTGKSTEFVMFYDQLLVIAALKVIRLNLKHYGVVLVKNLWVKPSVFVVQPSCLSIPDILYKGSEIYRRMTHHRWSEGNNINAQIS